MPHFPSPFAPVDGSIASEVSDSSGGAAFCGENDLKGEGERSMTLVDQVLHQDCIPALEFEIVSIKYPLEFVFLFPSFRSY